MTAYLTNLMTVSILYVVQRKHYVAIHVLPAIILFIGFFIYQENDKIIVAHIINITVFYIFSIFGSRMMYKAFKTMFAQELQLSEKTCSFPNGQQRWSIYPSMMS